MRDGFTGIFQVVPAKEQSEQLFALVVYAPPEVAHALDDIRRRYDPAFKENIKPHITIKRPAVLGKSPNLENIITELSAAATQIKPFPVVLNGYGVFNKPDANVVFLKVQDEAPFCELHSRTIAALDKVYPISVADRFEGNAYHPHLTIGNNLDNLELAVMEHELTTGQYRLQFAFWITCVILMTQTPGQTWNTVQTFDFTGE